MPLNFQTPVLGWSWLSWNGSKPTLFPLRPASWKTREPPKYTQGNWQFEIPKSKIQVLHQTNNFPLDLFFNTTLSCSRCVRSTLDAGTTTAVYFATIHKESSVLLADICSKMGQRAFVGKVSMDRNSPETYWWWGLFLYEWAIEHTFVPVKWQKIRWRILWSLLILWRVWIHSWSNQSSPQGLSPPARGVWWLSWAACRLSEALVSRLTSVKTSQSASGWESWSQIAKTTLRSGECVKLYFQSVWLQVYLSCGLLGPSTILAHCVHLAEEEVRTLRDTGAGVAHCPNSNFSLKSGVCDVRRLQKAGVKVIWFKSMNCKFKIRL